MIEMDINTFYFLPFRVTSFIDKAHYIDCMIYEDGKLMFIDSESYFIETEDGLKSLRKIMYPYEEN